MARFPKGSTPKLTNKLINKITSVIRAGASIESAVAYSGISKDTFYRWLKMSKESTCDSMLQKLSDGIWKAQAEHEVENLRNINKAAIGVPESYLIDSEGNKVVDEFGDPIVTKYLEKPNWRASAWMLAKRYPSRWGNGGESVDDFLGSKDMAEEESGDVIHISYYTRGEDGNRRLCTEEELKSGSY